MISAQRALIEISMTGGLASAGASASMKFDLASSRCVNEYEYCQRFSSLGPMSVEDVLQVVSLASMSSGMEREDAEDSSFGRVDGGMEIVRSAG